MTTEIIKSYHHFERIDVVTFQIGELDYTIKYSQWLSFMRWSNYMDGIIKEILECND